MRFAVFILALVVRIAAIEWTGAETIAFGDGPDYVATTRSLCTQHVYPERGNLPFFRAPGLPFFIAGVTACEPSRTRAIKYGLALCDAITVLLLFLLAGGNLFAAAMAGLHPFFVGGVTDIRGEPLFMMLLVAAIWLLVRDKPALCGIALGLAALTRPTGLLCIPLFAIAAWGALWPSRRVLAGGLVLATSLLTIAPWTIRNFVRFHELIPVNDAAGFNLWRGTHPDLLRTVETTDPALFAQRSLTFETETAAVAARAVESRAKTPGARDREWRRLAMENVRRDPRFALESAVKKALGYWRPWLHPAEHGTKAIAVSFVVTLTLYILGAIGLWTFPDRRVALAVGAFFVAMWLAHLPYIPTMRLRFPLTDPLLIVFASFAIARVRRFASLAVVYLPIVAVALLATQLASLPQVRGVIGMLQSARDSWWAIPLFVVLYAVFTLLLLPVGPLSAAAAVMWGWKVGGAIELVTCTLAALPPFLLARRRRWEWIERRLPRDPATVRDSPFTLFLLRLVPVLPYAALNYIAGTARIRARDYLVTTFAGSIPSVFVFAYFVDTMAASALGLATQAKLFAVCAGVALVAIIVRLAADRVARPS